jgi:hypothetical protein
MNKQQGSHRRLLAWMIFTTCVILATTTNYQNYGDNFSCGMRLGVGFPVAFLCDYAGGGGSPIDSWAKVDFADYPYFSLQGLLIDGSFDLIIAFSIARALHRYSRKDIHQLELYKQMYLITIVFAIGFFVASFIIKANQQIDLYRNYVFRHIQEHIPAPDFDLPGLLIGSLLSLIGAFVMVWTVHYI